MRRTAAALAATAAMLAGTTTTQAEAPAKALPVTFLSNTGWGWNGAPFAYFYAVSAGNIQMDMMCDAWMTSRGAVFGMMPGNRERRSAVTCHTYGKWVGKGVYTAHFAFEGLINNKKYVWFRAPNPDPSCRIQHPRLIFCSNIKRPRTFTKKGLSTAQLIGYRAVRR